jgi:hypothetical protein
MSFIINGKYNLTFVHIPKTGGTSITHWADENKKESSMLWIPDHPWYETVLEQDKHKNFSFTIVRNPWDRFVSMYFWISGTECLRLENGKEKFKKLIKNAPSTFELFVTESPKVVNPDYLFTSVTQQNRWIQPGVDLILRYENFEEDFVKIRDIFDDCVSPLPHENKTEHKHYREYYDDHTRKLVAKYFEEDIDTFKYQF